MMILVSEEDQQKLEAMDKWFILDENWNYVWRPGTPDEVKKTLEKLREKYYNPFE